MKSLSDRERKRRMLLKMCNSIENKLHGSDLIWWNSLSLSARYSFLFKWISIKEEKKFKHFLRETKSSYRPNLSNFRDASIEHLLKLK